MVRCSCRRLGVGRVGPRFDLEEGITSVVRTCVPSGFNTANVELLSSLVPPTCLRPLKRLVRMLQAFPHPPGRSGRLQLEPALALVVQRYNSLLRPQPIHRHTQRNSRSIYHRQHRGANWYESVAYCLAKKFSLGSKNHERGYNTGQETRKYNHLVRCQVQHKRSRCATEMVWVGSGRYWDGRQKEQTRGCKKNEYMYASLLVRVLVESDEYRHVVCR